MEWTLSIDVAQTVFIAGIFFRMGGFLEFSKWVKDELKKMNKRIKLLEEKHV